MGEKSRENWRIELCLKDCENEDKRCQECINFSCYLPEEKNVKVKATDRR